MYGNCNVYWNQQSLLSPLAFTVWFFFVGSQQLRWQSLIARNRQRAAAAAAANSTVLEFTAVDLLIELTTEEKWPVIVKVVVWKRIIDISNVLQCRRVKRWIDAGRTQCDYTAGTGVVRTWWIRDTQEQTSCTLQFNSINRSRYMMNKKNLYAPH